MPTISKFFIRPKLQQKLSQSWRYGIFTTVGVVATALVWNTKVVAQIPPVSENEVNSYAQAVLAMEPARQKAFEEIKKLIGGREIPKIVCSEANSMNGLSSQAKDIAVNYCNRSQKIVEENGLSSDRFNKITLEIQSNNELKRLIFNRLIYLQKVAEPR
ncbi:DUF4168 domain-containing protein [Fortiea contorta]|uniref:DUF4168 domain-containing protein n=1 Tax=Fortiea contorta TaxID=1892405 RepID=UPI000347049C|nr:DUF4168 domain-containing protein [Fortiea contorta]